MKVKTSNNRREALGQDPFVFGFYQRPVPAETAIRSGDHPERPVRSTKAVKKNETPAVMSIKLPKIWDLFAS